MAGYFSTGQNPQRAVVLTEEEEEEEEDTHIMPSSFLTITVNGRNLLHFQKSCI
jgi:hypothetical protein